MTCSMYGLSYNSQTQMEDLFGLVLGILKILQLLEAMFSILLHVASLCCSQPLDYLMMGPVQMEKYKFEDRLMERSSHNM